MTSTRDSIFYPYFLSNQLHLPVRIRINSIEIAQHVQNQSHFQDSDTPLDLTVTAQLFTQIGPVHSVPIYTNNKKLPSENVLHDHKVRWDEWLVFPCKYSDLDLLSAIEVHVLGVGSVKLFKSIIYLFDDKKRLKRGRQSIQIHSLLNKKFHDNNDYIGKPIQSESNRLFELFEKYSKGRDKKLEWLDQLTIHQVRENMKQSLGEAVTDYEHFKGQKDNGQSFITVEFPYFEYPVLFDVDKYHVANRISESLLYNTTNTKESMFLTCDPEVHNGRQNDSNPVEDKYYKLTRSILRGSTDPNLKPNRTERERIMEIINSSNKMKREDENLLWKFRFSLVNNKRALTKILCCVDWNNESEAKQAEELLDQWQALEVADALKLLSGEPEYKSDVVRKYAIRVLSKTTDEELLSFLLQLVQALRYDVPPDIPEDDDDENDRNVIRMAPKQDLGLLATFLIQRAICQEELASFFHWYLNVTILMQDKDAYRVFDNTHLKFISALHKSKKIDGAKLCASLTQQSEIIGKLLKAGEEVNQSRKEKVEKRQQKLRAMLKPGGKFGDLPTFNDAISLPLYPKLKVTGIEPDTVKILPSNTYPLVVDLKLDLSAMSPKAKASASPNFKVLFKDGDDLRQDQLILQLIGLMDNMFKDVNLDLNLTLYRVLATNRDKGLMEFVTGSYPLSKVLKDYKGIREFFRKQSPSTSEEGEDGISPQVLSRFIKSSAGYCVITYILGIGDRHMDNIMLKTTGQLFHLDFGYIFGRDPKPWPAPMRLTKEMIEGMGGRDSSGFQRFRSHCCQAYKVLRSNAFLILNLLNLMKDAEIPDLSINQDPNTVLFKIHDKFQLHLSDEEAETQLLRLIDQSADALGPIIMDFFHAAAMSVK